jgi:GGDEF domain-containing protein
VDPSTGVLSFAYLRHLLASEVARASRRDAGFTVIALTFNPRLWMDGTWDSAIETQMRLQQLANYLQMTVRRSDMVAFDGAGRFYVVALDASTTALCRRFQEASEQLRDRLDPIVKRPYPILLTGLARYPEDGKLPEDLLAHSHAELWHCVVAAPAPNHPSDTHTTHHKGEFSA